MEGGLCPCQRPAPEQRPITFRAKKGHERNRTINSRAQAANTRPIGQTRPSTLFHPASTLFPPGGSPELLAPSEGVVTITQSYNHIQPFEGDRKADVAPSGNQPDAPAPGEEQSVLDSTEDLSILTGTAPALKETEIKTSHARREPLSQQVCRGNTVEPFLGRQMGGRSLGQNGVRAQ